jgi:hypothetical protein
VNAIRADAYSPAPSGRKMFWKISFLLACIAAFRAVQIYVRRKPLPEDEDDRVYPE